MTRRNQGKHLEKMPLSFIKAVNCRIRWQQGSRGRVFDICSIQVTIDLRFRSVGPSVLGLISSLQTSPNLAQGLVFLEDLDDCNATDPSWRGRARKIRFDVGLGI